MTKSQHALATALAFAAITPAWGQVKCTMPNQRVIVLQTANKCPVDALKAETLDGVDITPPAHERPQKPKPNALPATQAKPKPVEKYTVVPKREEFVEPFDVARIICTTMKERQIGLCSIDQESRLGKMPNIRITTDGTTSDLRQLCEMLAQKAHELSQGSMRNRFWSINVFSKHDIFTPVASCRV